MHRRRSSMRLASLEPVRKASRSIREQALAKRFIDVKLHLDDDHIAVCEPYPHVDRARFVVHVSLDARSGSRSGGSASKRFGMRGPSQLSCRGCRMPFTCDFTAFCDDDLAWMGGRGRPLLATGEREREREIGSGEAVLSRPAAVDRLACFARPPFGADVASPSSRDAGSIP